MSNNLTQALQHASRGWYVFPCNADKKPYTDHGKNDATTDPEQIRKWWGSWPDALIGVYCDRSGLFALDVDIKDGRDGWRSLTELQEQHGTENIQVGPIQQTPSGGSHLIFKLPENLKIPNNADKLARGLDLRSNGYICTGGAYAWLPGHGPDVQLTEAPGWLLDLIRNLTPERKPQPVTMGAPSPDAGAYWLRYYLDRASIGNRNDTGFALALQLRDSHLPEAEAEPVMLDYAARVPQAPGNPYTERDALASLKSAYRGTAREPAHLPGLAMPIGNSTYHLQTGGNGHGPDLSKAPKKTPINELPTTTPTPGAYKLDDIGNGERLIARHGRKLRYVKEWGWLVWNGQYWEPDRGQVAAWAKETARSIYAEAAACEDSQIGAAIGKHAKTSASRFHRAAMIESAASEPGTPKTPADFDADPWLLNCQNGILDLRTGELQPHDPQAMLTKIAGASYDPDRK